MWIPLLDSINSKHSDKYQTGVMKKIEVKLPNIQIVQS